MLNQLEERNSVNAMLGQSPSEQHSVTFRVSLMIPASLCNVKISVMMPLRSGNVNDIRLNQRSFVL